MFKLKGNGFQSLQPAEDMGLRGGPVGEGASSIRSDQGRVSPFGSHELCRGKCPGTVPPHGGAVVHKRSTFHGGLGHQCVQRQGRVSTKNNIYM